MANDQNQFVKDMKKVMDKMQDEVMDDVDDIDGVMAMAIVMVPFMMRTVR